MTEGPSQSAVSVHIMLQETEARMKAEAELDKVRKDRGEGDPVPLVKAIPVSVGRGVEIRLGGGGDSDDSDDIATPMEGTVIGWLVSHTIAKQWCVCVQRASKTMSYFPTLWPSRDTHDTHPLQCQFFF